MFYTHPELVPEVEVCVMDMTLECVGTWRPDQLSWFGSKQADELSE